MRSRKLAFIAAALALGAIGSVHVVATHTQVFRKPDFDECQYLHGAWLIGQGQRLYRDFAEDHTPFLTLLLHAVQPSRTRPDYPTLDVRRFYARGRTLVALLGTFAVGFASLVGWRISRRASAPVIVAAALLGADWTWHRAVADIRNDPPTLALFFAGLLLVVWRRDGTRAALVRAGSGMGLVAIAALWNPKWPLESAVVGLFALASLWPQLQRALVWAAAPFAALVGVALGVLLSAASLRDYLFFTFQYNAGVMAWFQKSPTVAHWFANKSAFYHCAPPFRGLWPILACVVVGAALGIPRVRERWQGLDRRAAALVLALVLAGLVELRFVFPWPRLWPQHYLMWSFEIAMLYALVPGALVALLSGLRGSAIAVDAVAIAASLALFVWASRERLHPPRPDAYWRNVSWVQQHLRPGERVWLQPDYHPIGALDASYYWFAFEDLLPYTVGWLGQHRQPTPLPAVTEDDLPICRLERGLEPNLRFLSGPGVFAKLPKTSACLSRLLATGRLRPAPVPGTLEVVEEREP